MCTVIFNILSMSTVVLIVTSSALASVVQNRPKSTGPCVLPEYPEHGTYSVTDAPNATPGQGFNTLELNVTCKPEYGTFGESFVHCIDGKWSQKLPQCIQCGKVALKGKETFIKASFAKHNEVPWHVGIYRKTTIPYKQICSGSLVSRTVVISAAQCFWDGFEKLLPAENYAAAVGKIYRRWNSPQDKFAQKSDVRKIKIPPGFQGTERNFQDDIAIVKLVTPFEYKTYVRPVCLDFDSNLEHAQLQEGNLGKVAGWGPTAEDGKLSELLKDVNLPYIDIDTCFRQTEADFREYITSDKICTGYDNGTAICRGDGGGGLVFPVTESSTERYYLRGIASVKPVNEQLCNAFTVTLFTNILSHQQFIKENIIDSE